MSLRLSTLLLASFCACGPEGRNTPLPARGIELEAPAGVGTGEPHLSPLGDSVLLSWLEVADGGHDLWVAGSREDGWGERGVVVVYRDRRAQDVRDIYLTRRTDASHANRPRVRLARVEVPST